MDNDVNEDQNDLNDNDNDDLMVGDESNQRYANVQLVGGAEEEKVGEGLDLKPPGTGEEELAIYTYLEQKGKIEEGQMWYLFSTTWFKSYRQYTIGKVTNRKV